MSARHFWINQAFFQASWPACVIGAAHDMLWPGILVVGLFALWQLHPRRRHRHDFRALGAFAATGLVVDTLWLQMGVVEYAMAWPTPGLVPAWLMLLWVALGLTVNHSLAVFKHRWYLFTLLAMVGSPASYSVAAGFGAVTWTSPAWLVIVCVGPAWAGVVGLLFRLSPSSRKTAVAAGQLVEGAGG